MVRMEEVNEERNEGESPSICVGESVVNEKVKCPSGCLSDENWTRKSPECPMSSYLTDYECMNRALSNLI